MRLQPWTINGPARCWASSRSPWPRSVRLPANPPTSQYRGPAPLIASGSNSVLQVRQEAQGHLALRAGLVGMRMRYISIRLNAVQYSARGLRPGIDAAAAAVLLNPPAFLPVQSSPSRQTFPAHLTAARAGRSSLQRWEPRRARASKQWKHRLAGARQLGCKAGSAT